MKNSNLLVAFLVGAAAGAGLGLLFAPRTGKETRKKIKDSVHNLSEKAKETYSKYMNKEENKENE